MKFVLILCLAVATVLGAAPGAAAFKLAPPSVGFSGSGAITITTPSGGAYKCKLALHGATNAIGVGRITSAHFIPGPAACANTAASGLPWKAVAVTAATAKILNMGVITPFGNCGLATVPVAISGGGVWTINHPLPPACLNVSASFATAPPIKIVP
jgi:hypothetical protein